MCAAWRAIAASSWRTFGSTSAAKCSRHLTATAQLAAQAAHALEQIRELTALRETLLTIDRLRKRGSESEA